MDELVGLFIRTVFIGLAVAAPVGAMAILCIQRTVADGWRSGMATGLGIATADAAFAAVAAFGLSAFSQWLVAAQAPLRIIGGIVLIWLGVRAILTPARTESEVISPSSGSRHYATAVGLTLTNPMTIIAFAGIFAGAGLVAQPGLVTAAVATLGVAIGSFAWWLALVSGVFALRHAVSPRIMVVINRASGVLLSAFGVLALFAGAAALHR